MHQRLRNSVAKPASGPDCSVPATGCAGTKCTPSGRCGATCATTEPLTEPTSETIAPGFERAGDLRRDGAVGADRHAQDDEIGAGDAGRGVARRLVGEAELAHPRQHRLVPVDRDDACRPA